VSDISESVDIEDDPSAARPRAKKEFSFPSMGQGGIEDAEVAFTLLHLKFLCSFSNFRLASEHEIDREVAEEKGDPFGPTRSKRPSANRRLGAR
jgi:hypothetical protein